MYDSAVVSLDYWRHHVPVAPDIEIDAIVGEATFIDLKPYMIQGARDYEESFSPNPGIQPERVAAQRGWLLDTLLAVPGRKGIVIPSAFKDGFTYTPNNNNPTTSDCFNYQFSNGTQKSNYGKVTLNVILPFKPDWKIFATTEDVYFPGRSSDQYRMTFKVTPAHPDYRMGHAVKYRWHLVGPVVEMRDGIPYIVQKDTVIYETRWYYYYGSLSYIDKGENLTRRLFKTDSDLVGIDARTNAPYIPTNTFPHMYIELLNYPRRYTNVNGSFIDWTVVQRFIYNINDYFGKYWNRSGKITIE